MKEYMKPELEIVSLMTEETVTTELLDEGELELSTNPFNNL